MFIKRGDVTAKMVEIVRIEGPSPRGIDELIDLYVLSFRSKMTAATDDQAREMAAKEFESITTDSSRVLYGAYEGRRPVGFLMAGRMTEGIRVLTDATLDLIYARYKDERGLTYVALRMLILGKMVLQGYLCADPRTILSDWKMEVITNVGLTARKTIPEDMTKYATAVHPDHQGNGIATRLNEVLEEDARKGGAHLIQTVCTDNPVILEVNAARGYRPILVTTPFYADRSPAFFMIKELSPVTETVR